MRSPALPTTETARLILEAAEIWWDHLQLEEPLELGGGCTQWLATDLRDGLRYIVEPLRTVAGGPLTTTEEVVRVLNECCIFSHPNLLTPYRVEGVWPNMATVTPFRPVLKVGSLRQSIEVAAQDPELALTWLNQLTAMIAGIHDSGSRFHGAITPSRVSANQFGDLLLMGYPFASYRPQAMEAMFLRHANKERGATPQLADDIYGLAALAYFLFSGGDAPSRTPDRAMNGKSIDQARADRTLPPIAWSPGWDAIISSVLSGKKFDPELSPREWINALNEPSGRPPLTREASGRAQLSSVNASARRVRRWSHAHRQTQANRREAPADLGTESAVSTLVKLQQKEAALEVNLTSVLRRERLAAEERSRLAVEQDRLALSSAEIEREKKRLVEVAAGVEQRSKEVLAERDVVDGERQKIALAGDEVEKKKSDLRRASEQLAIQEAEAKRRAESLAAEQTDFLKAQKDLRKAEEGVAQQKAEAAALLKTAREKEATIQQITGGTSVDEWRAFVEKLINENKAFREPRPTPVELPSSATTPPIVLPAIGPTISTPQPASPSVPAAQSPAAPELPSAPLPATLSVGSPARRLHVYSSTRLRFGRLGTSDVLLVALLTGQSQPTMSLNREISRKHFELEIVKNEVRVRDGWSDDGKASQHGICVDGRRVSGDDVTVRPGALLSVTKRVPGKSIPHWRVSHVTNPAAPKPELSALFLKRLDDAPDDILIVLTRVSLSDLGYKDYGGLSIVNRSGKFRWENAGESKTFSEQPVPVEGVSVISDGFVSPTLAVL